MKKVKIQLSDAMAYRYIYETIDNIDFHSLILFIDAMLNINKKNGSIVKLRNPAVLVNNTKNITSYCVAANKIYGYNLIYESLVMNSTDYDKNDKYFYIVDRVNLKSFSDFDEKCPFTKENIANDILDFYNSGLLTKLMNVTFPDQIVDIVMSYVEDLDRMLGYSRFKEG